MALWQRQQVAGQLLCRGETYHLASRPDRRRRLPPYAVTVTAPAMQMEMEGHCYILYSGVWSLGLAVDLPT
jgi:hypothetical protein